jgi:membrane-bound lytic murein transglycosylase B
MRGTDARRTVRNGACMALCLALSGAGGIASATMHAPAAAQRPATAAPGADDQAAQAYSLAGKVSTVADLPPLSKGLTHEPASRTVPDSKVTALGSGTVPDKALMAYLWAATIMREVDPDCGLVASLVAAIGRVESDHGRYGGAVLGEDGVSHPVIRGVALDGSPGLARIVDSDGGRLDGDKRWDRAVGPMQFLPSTWRAVGVDGDGDGRTDPQDVEDAAATAAGYLCSGGRDLADPAVVSAAVLSYNHSRAYLQLVLTYAARFAGAGLDAVVGSDGTGSLPVLAQETRVDPATSLRTPATPAGRGGHPAAPRSPVRAHAVRAHAVRRPDQHAAGEPDTHGHRDADR